MNTRFLLLLSALGCCHLATAQVASVPTLLNYQGRVIVEGVNFDSQAAGVDGQFRFMLVNEDASVVYWQNSDDADADGQPDAAVALPVSRGLYSVLLGDATLMAPIDPAIFANPDIRLRVFFDDTIHGSQLLTPDHRIAPAPYLGDGAVHSATLADGSVIAEKIGAGAVTGVHVLPGALDFSHLSVPAAPGDGQVLGFDGASLVWTNGIAGGDSIFSRNGTSAFYSAGNVGLGTSTPAHRLSIAAAPLWTSNSWGGAIAMTNGHALGWASNGAGQRFGIGQTNGGLFFFRTASDPGTTAFPATYDLWINDGGNVVMTGGGPGFLTVGSPNGETGLTLQRDGGRADVRFNGTSIKIAAHAVAGPPPSTFGLAVTTAGNVGVGTDNPASKLHVAGGLTYDARLSKLDVSDSFVSTVRSADFFFGHSTRRGLPGRALVDLGTSLVVNFNNDWGTTVIGGAVTQVTTLMITGGSDLAEPFQMKEETLEKGSVVVIDEEHPGRLKQSQSAYDTRVAGIVSGANGVQPGIALHQEGVLEGGQNVALSGRVYVRADTSGGAIQPGDLLTTSSIPGQAMRVADRSRSQGAVLGKAMSALAEGEGMVLVLVSLQ